MEKRPHAEIAGAGFAGMSAAIALRQRGWTVRVHEIDRELRAYGAGIFIWENGLRVLDALDAYGDTVTGAHEAPFYDARSDRHELLTRESFGPARGSRMLTMTRQHLFNALLGAAQRAGVDFVTGSEAVGATPDGTLLTADGRAHRADLVIGADGVKSKVRDFVSLLKERIRYRQGVIRLLVPRHATDLGGADGDSVINFWSPRYRILYVPCNDRELYILLSASVSDEEATALPIPKPLWIAAFPLLADIIGRIGTDGRYDVYETTRLTAWSLGKVAIIGDAAHAMPPTIGQGAGCAMMNALGLAVALEETGDIAEGLALWERRERPLTEHTQMISSEFAQRRAGADGTSKWDDAAMRTARCAPTGAASTWPRAVPA